jgi:hypothetical protein
VLDVVGAGVRVLDLLMRNIIIYVRTLVEGCIRDVRNFFVDYFHELQTHRNCQKIECEAVRKPGAAK